MAKNVLRCDVKRVFPNTGLRARLVEQQNTSAKIVARNKRAGRPSLRKHLVRAMED